MNSLHQALERLLERVQKLPEIELVQKKAIPYGVALYFRSGNEKNNLNIYFSEKKGVSIVLGGKKETSLAAKLQEICGLSKSIPAKKHSWSRWAGTDESGKGDFFGPLVVAGFVADKSILNRLQDLGVDDCKKLDDRKIVGIASALYREFPHNCRVLALLPEKYNKIYAEFRERGQKLNHMMVWLHTAAVLKLKQAVDFQGVVIDKFTSERMLKDFAPAEFLQIPCIFREKAEDDLAVAAASILARAEFLKQMTILSKKCGFPLHKGASSFVEKDAREFVARFSKEKLPLICKTHFKTYDEILG